MSFKVTGNDAIQRISYDFLKTVSHFVGTIYSLSQKSNPQKSLNNILAYAKPFRGKLCPLIGNLYPNVTAEFGEFTLKFIGLGVRFH